MDKPRGGSVYPDDEVVVGLDDRGGFGCTWHSTCGEDAVQVRLTRLDHWHGEALCPVHLAMVRQVAPPPLPPEPASPTVQRARLRSAAARLITYQDGE